MSLKNREAYCEMVYSEMNLIKFLDEIGKLKTVRRTGWVERGVRLPESSADHSFMVALQALIIGSERTDLNMTTVLKMSIIHDVAECQIGDIVTKESWPAGGSMTAKEKYALEKRAFVKLLENLSPITRKEILATWTEFENGKSREAMFVKSVDKFETIVQAMRYAKAKNSKKSLEGFWDSNAIKSIKDADVRKLLIKLIVKS